LQVPVYYDGTNKRGDQRLVGQKLTRAGLTAWGGVAFEHEPRPNRPDRHSQTM
jgi:hypothetical protein